MQVPAGVAPFLGHIIVGLVELSWLFSMIALGSDSWSSYSIGSFTVSFGLWNACTPAVDGRGQPTGGTVCSSFNACDPNQQNSQCNNVGGARTFTVLCFLALLFAAISVPLYVYQAKLTMVYMAIPASMGKLKEQLQRKMMHVILCACAFGFALIGWACWTGVQNGVNSGGAALGYSAGFGLMVTLWIFIGIAAGLLWIAPIAGAPDTPAGGAKPATGATTTKPVGAQPAGAQPTSAPPS